MTSPHRIPAPGPTYRWRCAYDVALALQRFVRDEYGLQVRLPKEDDVNTPRGSLSFNVGPYAAESRAHGVVLLADLSGRILWSEDDGPTEHMRKLVRT